MSDLQRDDTPEDQPTTPAEAERPEEQAHGGSMAPGLVDDDGTPSAAPPEAEPTD